MYKQRGTKEARRARYERMLERNTHNSGYKNGPGKAFAGSRKNKHQAKHLRHASLTDWATFAVNPRDLENVPAWADKNLMRLDHSHGSKPEHASRAVKIDTCFPQIIVASEKDTESLLMRLKSHINKR